MPDTVESITPELKAALILAGWLTPEDGARIRRRAEGAYKNGEQVDPGDILDIVGYSLEGDDQ
jgi:hypothetical protein